MKVLDSSRVERVGVQTVGKEFEEAGYIFREQPISDYGIDAHIELVDDESASGQLIALQIKSGSSWFKETTSDGYVFRGSQNHLEYWLTHSLPVLVVLCDTENGISYWQAVLPENVISTRNAWKLCIPRLQRINPGMNVDLKRLVEKLPIHKDYSIVATKDVSHGVAKRYSLRIVLSKEFTQSEIISLIKSVTAEAANCDYHRSEITREHWRSTAAHVVWLNIYPSAEDEKNNNYLCESEWFSELLHQDFIPSSNNGEQVAPGIKVRWNTGYLTDSRYNAKYAVTKENYVLQVTRLVHKLKPVMLKANKCYQAYEKMQLKYVTLCIEMKKEFDKADEIYQLGVGVDLSPYECKDLNIKFQSMITHAHNAYSVFGRYKNMDEQQSIYNLRSQVDYYREALEGFEYELAKIR